MSDLVKRLRESAFTLNRPGGILNPMDWVEAADRIEALKGEVAELEERLQAVSIHAGELDARAERLRVALEKLKAHPSIGAIVFTEQHVASGQPSVTATSALYVINKALEDDKQ